MDITHYIDDINIINQNQDNINNEKVDMIINTIYDFFNNYSGLKSKLYLDNITSINYIFNNKINKINLYCILENTNLSNIISKIKNIFSYYNEIQDKNKFRVKLIVTNNYSNIKISEIKNNPNRNLDQINILYSSDNINNFPINIYFFNDELFYKHNGFKKINPIYLDITIANSENNDTNSENNDTNSENNNTNSENNNENNYKYNLSDLYYQFNTNLIYFINKQTNLMENINSINKFNLSNQIEKIINYNTNIFYIEPLVLLELISYYLLTKLNFYKELIVEFIKIYSANKSLKKKIKLIFNMDEQEYLTKILLLFNLIYENSLDENFLEFDIEFPIIKKILFGIENINTYLIPINNISVYIKLIFINKYKIVSKHFLNYTSKFFVKENIFQDKEDNKGNDIICNNLDIILNDNKLNIYKKLRKNKLFFIDVLGENNNIFSYRIKIFCKIISTLFYADKELIGNIESLKFAYIYKNFYNLEKNDFDEIFIFYNSITKYIGLSNFILHDNYFYKMLSCKELIKYEIEKMNNLQTIRKKYESNEDFIDIYDYQDSISLVYDLLYLTNTELSDYDFLKLTFNEYFESSLANIRSNKLLQNHFNNLESNSEFHCYFDSDFDSDSDFDKELNLFAGTKKKYKIKNGKLKNKINKLNKIDESDNLDDVIDVDLNFPFSNLIDNYLHDIDTDSDIDNYYNDNYLNNNYFHENNYHEETLDEYLISNEKHSENNQDDIIDLNLIIPSNPIDEINKIMENYNYNSNIKSDDENYDSSIINFNDFTNINNSIKLLKYQRYKDEYVKLKKIYEIISNDYFDINMCDNNYITEDSVEKIIDYYKFNLSTCADTGNHINIKSNNNIDTDSDTNTESDTDTDSYTNTESDTDSDTNTESDTDSDNEFNICNSPIFSKKIIEYKKEESIINKDDNFDIIETNLNIEYTIKMEIKILLDNLIRIIEFDCDKKI
jgi:hypothetical protein